MHHHANQCSYGASLAYLCFYGVSLTDLFHFIYVCARGGAQDRQMELLKLEEQRRMQKKHQLEQQQVTLRVCACTYKRHKTRASLRHLAVCIYTFFSVLSLSLSLTPPLPLDSFPHSQEI